MGESGPADCLHVVPAVAEPLERLPHGHVADLDVQGLMLADTDGGGHGLLLAGPSAAGSGISADSTPVAQERGWSVRAPRRYTGNGYAPVAQWIERPPPKR